MNTDSTEIFIIPIGDKYAKKPDHVNIIYSPLHKICCLADQSTALQLSNDLYLKNREKQPFIPPLKQSPDEYTTLSLLPNHICNFRCKYCYSAAGRSKTIIERDKLKRGLDFFVNPDRIPPQTLKMFISGGGEPLLTWEDTKFAITYACERALEYGFTLWVSIISNGSVINEEIINTLEKYKCSICISFEVLEPLQNELRGNYRKVCNTLREYGKTDIPVMLNSTITPLSIPYMEEMVQEVMDQYPFVRNYTLEPVTDYTLFESPEAMRDFYRQFSNTYRKIRALYSQNKTSLWFTLEEMADTLKMRYCPGKLCLTPEGTFSICHCTSSPLEERYQKCQYGQVTNEGVTFDLKKFRALIHTNGLSREKCKDCFARWNCGGECLTRWDQYPAAYMDEVCRFNRGWLCEELEIRLDKQYREERGMSLREVINSYK
ncbi:MAG: radical SAM protein [Tannerellaceae bacterium]|nr:radical SAM protein [Tannerellaceae bacterium]